MTVPKRGKDPDYTGQLPGDEGTALSPEDLERRRQRLARLRESALSFRELLEGAPDAFYLYDLQGMLIDGNAAAEQLIGYPSEELVGKNIFHAGIMNPIHIPQVVAKLDSLARGEPFGPIEVEVIRKDGESRLTEVRAYPLDLGGERVVMGVAQDLSSRRRSLDEQRIAERLQSIAVLAGGIAHDFNNLLTAIVGNLSLVGEAAEPGSKTRRRLGEAERACQRARDLTHKLLTFADGSVPLTRPMKLDHLIEYELNAALEGDEIRWEVDSDEELWLVEVDQAQFRPVLQNLVGNAQDAMPGGGSIRVTLRNVVLGGDEAAPLEPGAFVKVELVDTGQGISRENLSRVFDPYFTTKEMGTGLGLAIAYSVVNNHGGHLTIRSQTGVGTTVSILLPIVEQLDETAPSFPDATSPRFGTGRILMMDDEELIRDVGMLILTELGYRVSLARNGEEAVELFREAKEAGRPFDAVILDLTVPEGLGGRETLERMRQIDPDVKAIVSSGYSNDPILGKFRDYGFRAAVPKPYTPRYLSAVLKAVLEGRT